MNNVFEITTSSAISKVAFDDSTKIINVTYTSSDKEYQFEANEYEEVKTDLMDIIINTNDSIGKYVNSLKKDGRMVIINN